MACIWLTLTTPGATVGLGETVAAGDGDGDNTMLFTVEQAALLMQFGSLQVLDVQTVLLLLLANAAAVQNKNEVKANIVR